MYSSRITWSSNSNAVSTASPNAAASGTLATPMDDPRLAGFTKTGRPRAAIASSIASADHDERDTSRHAATGRPASCRTALAMPLSMQMAEESTPAPT